MRRVPVVLLLVVLLLVGCAGGDQSEPTASQDEGDAATAADPVPAEVVRTATCDCCGAHADHLREAGFAVTETIVTHDELAALRDARQVPEEVRSCHTTLVGDHGEHVAEGHVPAEAIEWLRTERADADGLAVPGMPSGSPGMPGELDGPLPLQVLADGRAAPLPDLALDGS